ncbi:class I SAM-dependent methyltransferase [Pseudooceanicola sp.]|uniref:class I SAM-dependent methyltransferase n=1 Tax=Pseudooceanicola sp. TaxID=1914328 RepID=UPI0035C715A7
MRDRADPAFDGVAAGYDARFTNQPITRHLRAEVMETVFSLLPARGGKVLEVGCGTGADARSLADRGHRVLATDAAPEMLRLAEAKAGERQDFECALWRIGDAVPPQVTEGAPYDMVFSNFGALNCVEDLPGFGQDCAALVRPGGHVVLVLINRWCLMEVLLGALRRDRTSMTRRFRKIRDTRLEDGTRLRVHFPSTRDVAAAIGASFSLIRREPVGVFLPPSEYFESFQRRPRLLRAVFWLDRTLGHLWPLFRLGDHVLIVLRREDGS